MGFEPQTLEFKVNLHSQPKNKPYGTLKFDKTLLKIKSLTENENISVPRKYKMAHLDFLRYLFKKLRINVLT